MKRSLSVVVLTALLTGCGGGGATIAPQPSAPSGPSRPTAATTISMTIPRARQTSGARRRPAYISSATNSMVVTPQGQSPIMIPLTATSPGCSVVAGGRQCTVTASLPVGTYPITIALYWTTNGTDSPLAMTTTTQTIALDVTNTLNFTLNAVVSLITDSLSPGSTFTAGTASTKTITVTASDPAGATIVVGTDALIDANGSPVTIQLGDTDTSGATSISPTTAGAVPSTLSYNGATPNGTTVTATAKNASNVTVASAQTSFAVISPTSGTPSPTLSRYVQTVDYTTLYQEGQSMRGTSGLVILDFGQPWHCVTPVKDCSPAQVNTYGTFLPNDSAGQPYKTIADITAAAEAFLDGYYVSGANNTQTLRLAIGTNNFCLTAADCAEIDFTQHGAAWGQMVQTLETYVENQGYGQQEYVAGASDMELEWNSAAETEEWVQAFASANTQANPLILYDYGDASGCPTTIASSPGNRACNPSGGYSWTQADVLYIAGENDSQPVPEIYCSPGDANEWYELSRFSVAQDFGKILIPGTLTEYSAATERGAVCEEGVAVNTPQQGFQQLQEALDGDPTTVDPSLVYSTDITYSTVVPSPLSLRRADGVRQSRAVDARVGVPATGPIAQRALMNPSLQVTPQERAARLLREAARHSQMWSR